MSRTRYKLDVLALSETSEKEDTGFLSDVELDDFQKFHTASNSKGGTVIYANKNFMIERSDTSQTLWNTKVRGLKSNTGVKAMLLLAFRHPRNNFKDFFQYLEKC